MDLGVLLESPQGSQSSSPVGACTCAFLPSCSSSVRLPFDTLSIKSEIISVATFVPGETAVSYMASAAAIAYGLGIDNEKISDGLAEYDPEQ